MKRLLKNELGQDLIEYTLLMAFVALAAAALLLGTGGSISSIWTTANTSINQAAGAAAAGLK